METIKIGSTGDSVRVLQKYLCLMTDGVFGPKTEQVVKQFQKSHGLTVDGVVGTKTWAALEANEIAIADGHITTNISRSANRQIKYIAIHYTAGRTSKKGAAMAARSVFLQQRRASADFIVDDDTIVRVNPDVNNYYCWAVGDKKNAYSGGGSLYGKATNKNTISIEICSNLKNGTTASSPNHAGWYFTQKSLDNTLKLVRHLMLIYNVHKSNIVRHYDISGKLCPGVIGWNNAHIYDTNGKITKQKGNSNEWMAFLSKI